MAKLDCCRKFYFLVKILYSHIRCNIKTKFIPRMPKTDSRDHISKPAEFLAPVADYFKVLSEISRLQILSCLKTGPMNVSEIGEATGLGQANLSKHLKMLTEAEILSRHPQGVAVYYEIQDPMIFELCELVCDRLYQRMQQKAEKFKRLNTFSTSAN